MRTILVKQPFTLTQQDGTKREFSPGEHEVEDALAAHWYVQAHSDIKPLPKAAEPTGNQTAKPAAASGASPADPTNTGGGSPPAPTNKSGEPPPPNK